MCRLAGMLKHFWNTNSPICFLSSHHKDCPLPTPQSQPPSSTSWWYGHQCIIKCRWPRVLFASIFASRHAFQQERAIRRGLQQPLKSTPSFSVKLGFSPESCSGGRAPHALRFTMAREWCAQYICKHVSPTFENLWQVGFAGWLWPLTRSHGLNLWHICYFTGEIWKGQTTNEEIFLPPSHLHSSLGWWLSST